MKFFCLLAILIGVFSVDISCQQPRFDRFDVSSGLSQNNINGLVIDQNGNIWAGTLDGLNRFDGSGFEVFKPGPEGKNHISGNHVTTMGKGFDGDVWIHTRGGGLDRYDASGKKFLHYADSIFQNGGVAPVSNLVQVDDSLLLFSDGPRLGVFDLTQNQCINLRMPGFVSGIEQGPESAWVYGEFGIRHYALSARDHGSSPLNLLHQIDTPCYQLTRAGDFMYALFDSGIWRFAKFEGEGTQMIAFDALNLPKEDLSSMNSFAVRDSVFWLGGNNILVNIEKQNGVWKTRPFEYEPSNDYSFKGHHVTAMAFDPLGNLWVGTLKNGLNLFNHERNLFSHYHWGS